MTLIEIFFFISVLSVFHAYIGYPFSLFLLSLAIKHEIKKHQYHPFVTLIITVHNEENRIREKLDNTCSIDYPKDKLQTIVASDGSTDKTNEIVKHYQNHEIELLQIKERLGKEYAQKKAIEISKGEVLVFSDAATRIDSDGLAEIVSNFSDQSVGCASSEDRMVTKDGQTSGEGIYLKYEMWLRKVESKVNSLVGLTGAFFAVRREVLNDFSGEMQSDFRTVLSTVRGGLRAVTDPKALGYYLDIGDQSREFERKVRTVVRGMTVFFSHLEFLNILKYRLFSYQYFCHKLLRWLVPAFLAIAFISNLILAFESALFAILLLAQILFYLMAVLGIVNRKLSSNLLIKIPAYFTNVNLSIAFAWLKFLSGERVVMWQPSKR
jgi:cellulose synthase/poly-beta-1,6-N-acetylglucosamine synthase-like glycosyltransferase